MDDEFVNGSLYKIAGRDGWVYRCEVNMRFEDDGLRTFARWQLRKPGGH